MTEVQKNRRNWAGNYSYSAAEILSPTSVDELCSIVASSSKVRALGSRHSFNDIADTSGVLVSLEGLPTNIVLDPVAMNVRVGGGTRYGVLATELARHGYALHNLASLPHISIAGAIATATHGSGDRNGNLATAVEALRFIDAGGNEREVNRVETADFAAYVVGLGALGIVTEVTLSIEPHFNVAQHVYQELPWEEVLDNLDDITSAAYSVSLFTNWSGNNVGQAWFKQRIGDGRTEGFPQELFGGKAADSALHPLPGVSAVNCTQQLGHAGSWSDRLSHFRMDYLPSSGDEIQSEYLVGREFAVEAIEAMRALSEDITPILQISEIRTMAADELWLSSNYQRDGIGLHFTWIADQEAVESVLPRIEAALAPFAARPHWGKVFTMSARELVPLYPRMADFKALMKTLDPDGKFSNNFLSRAGLVEDGLAE